MDNPLKPAVAHFGLGLRAGIRGPAPEISQLPPGRPRGQRPHFPCSAWGGGSKRADSEAEGWACHGDADSGSWRRCLRDSFIVPTRCLSVTSPDCSESTNPIPPGVVMDSLPRVLLGAQANPRPSTTIRWISLGCDLTQQLPNGPLRMEM